MTGREFQSLGATSENARSPYVFRRVLGVADRESGQKKWEDRKGKKIERKCKEKEKRKGEMKEEGEETQREEGKEKAMKERRNIKKDMMMMMIQRCNYFHGPDFNANIRTVGKDGRK